MFKSNISLHKYNKGVSRGGGPLPHGDPPDMKPIIEKRYYNFGDHLLWINSGYTKEYAFNLKHLYTRGISGALMVFIKYYGFKLVIPFFIFVHIRHYSHDYVNYYRKEFTLNSGPHAPHGNEVDRMKVSKINPNEYDFLGRRTDFYKSQYREDFTIKNSLERKLEREVLLKK